MGDGEKDDAGVDENPVTSSSKSTELDETPSNTSSTGASISTTSNMPEREGRLPVDEPMHLKQFMLTELNIAGEIQGGQLTIRRRFKQHYLQNIFKDYVNQYVNCATCGSASTTIYKDQAYRFMFLSCESCGASRSLNAVAKGYHAIDRADRRNMRK